MTRHARYFDPRSATAPLARVLRAMRYEVDGNNEEAYGELDTGEKLEVILSGNAAMFQFFEANPEFPASWTVYGPRETAAVAAFLEFYASGYSGVARNVRTGDLYVQLYMDALIITKKGKVTYYTEGKADEARAKFAAKAPPDPEVDELLRLMESGGAAQDEAAERWRRDIVYGPQYEAVLARLETDPAFSTVGPTPRIDDYR